jgi:hypothetical protein
VTDLHTRFGAWLESGAEGEPSRDVALHASACPDCQRLIAAFDALATVDLTLAPDTPPSADRGTQSFSPLARAGRYAVAAAATVLLGAVVAIGGSRLAVDDTEEATPEPTREEVLTGIEEAPRSASPRPSPSGSPSPSPTPEATATASPTATESTVVVSPPPPTARPPAPPPPPPPPPPSPPAPTVAPPPSPTSTPTPQPPGPIPQPTPTPTPEAPPPTPTPAPTPTPPPN